MTRRSQQDIPKKPLIINPFCEGASAEPPLDWTKWAAILEMAVFAKDGIEIRNLLRARPTLVEPAEPVYELEIQGETGAQRKSREVRNQEKRVGWENHVIKAREKGVLCNSYRWDEADARVRSYLFLCLGAEGQRQVQQKRPKLVLHNVTIQEFMTTLEEIFVINRIVAFERYNFICRQQKKSESLEQFYADIVELASRADCGDRKDEWGRDMFTADMHNEKVAEELLAQTRTPQDAYEYAIRLEKGIEHSRIMKINPFGGQTATKQEPVHYINTRGGRYNSANNQSSQSGRGGFRDRPYPRGSQNTRWQQRNHNTNNSKNVTNAETNTIRTFCNLARRKIKFSTVCRSTNVNYLGTWQDEQQEEIETESIETEKGAFA